MLESASGTAVMVARRAARTVRWWPGTALLMAAAASAGAVSQTADPTWQAVWIGLSATCASAGLVDVAGLIEKHRTTKPIQRMAARRVGRVQQLILQVMMNVFGNPKTNESDPWIASFEAMPDDPIDLTQPAEIYPPRTKAQHVFELVRELRNLQLELSTYAATGVLGTELSGLDELLSSSTFLGIAEWATVTPKIASRKFLIEDAANLLTAIQPAVAAARRAAGSTWIYGVPLS